MYDPGYYTIDNAPAGTLPDVIYAVDLHASNTIFSSNLLITGEILENGNPGTSGQVLTSGGPGLPVYWGTGGGGGASQWTGAIGSPIYYVSNVGIGSTNTPTSNLMVTGNVYVSKDVTTTNIFGNVISFDTKASNALIGNLFGNVTSFDTKASNALIGNLFGNVTSFDTKASNALIGNLFGNLSGNVSSFNTVASNALIGNLFGNVTSFDTKASNALIGNLFGNVTSFDTKASNALIGNLFGNLSGNVSSFNTVASNALIGPLFGNLSGNVSSFNTVASNALIGNLFGNVTSFDTKASNALIGNLSGNVNSVNITASNLMVSNLITTSNIICDAFSTSSSLNFNFVTNPPPARSTSSGWQGIRQVFGDHVTGNVYVYNNKVLETTFTSLNPGFGAFVAIGGPSDNLIAVSGNGEFYVYYFNGTSWQGPSTITTGTYMDPGGVFGSSLWMPSIGAINTIVIGPYGYTSEPGSPNPSVGVFNWNDGDVNFVTTISPDGDPERYTVAISGDERTVAIGAGFIGILCIYNLRDPSTPAFRYTTTSDSYYNVSINYDGTIVLLTHGGLKQVLMFALN